MFFTDGLTSKYGKDFALSPRAMSINPSGGGLRVGGSASLLLDKVDSRTVMHIASLDTKMQADNLRDISLAEPGKWIYRTPAQILKATNVLRIYFEAAQRMFGETSDQDTKWVFDQADRLVDDLDKDPLSLDELEWVKKRHLADKMGFMGSAKERVEFDRSWHCIDPMQSVYAVKVRNWSADSAVVRAQNEPPKNTRAVGRSKIVIDLTKRTKQKSDLRLPIIDWDKISRGDHVLQMPNPLKTYEQEADEYLAKY